MKKRIAFLLITLLCCTSAFSALATGFTQDRYASSYNPTLFDNGYFQYRMNCYGYALQMFFGGDLTAETGGFYLQQPGEFAADTQTFAGLVNDYNYHKLNNTLHSFVQGKLAADMQALGYTLTQVPGFVTPPAGMREIVLVSKHVGSISNSDSHFYFRHSNGTWSHKRGNTPVTNLSIDTHVPLTDANIVTASQEGGYDDGQTFYLISKDAVPDYPHASGHTPNTCLQTQTSFLECAGNTITACTTVGGSVSARFDYPGDVDWYRFVPTQTKTYIISASVAGNASYVHGLVVDENGSFVGPDPNNGHPVFTLTLTAGKEYYICFSDSNNQIVNYSMLCYPSIPTPAPPSPD